MTKIPLPVAFVTDTDFGVKIFKKVEGNNERPLKGLFFDKLRGSEHYRLPCGIVKNSLMWLLPQTAERIRKKI